MDNDLYTVWPIHNTVVMFRVLFSDDRPLNSLIKLMFGSSSNCLFYKSSGAQKPA